MPEERTPLELTQDLEEQAEWLRLIDRTKPSTSSDDFLLQKKRKIEERRLSEMADEVDRLGIHPGRLFN